MSIDYSGRMADPTIPGKFQRLDTAVTDPDRFVNTRDRNTVARNHNILLARGCQQPLLHIAQADTANGSFWVVPPSAYHLSGVNQARADISPILQAPIIIPPYLTEVAWSAYATNDGAPGVSNLYATVDSEMSQAMVTAESKSSLPSPLGESTGVATVPEEAARDGYGIFSLYLDTAVAVGNIWAPPGLTVLDAGPDWVEVDDAAGGAGAGFLKGAVLFAYDIVAALRQDMAPRTVTPSGEIHFATSSRYRFYVDAPWTAAWAIGDDTVQARNFEGIRLSTVSVWPSAVSDFYGEVKR